MEEILVCCWNPKQPGLLIRDVCFVECLLISKHFRSKDLLNHPIETTMFNKSMFKVGMAI